MMYLTYIYLQERLSEGSGRQCGAAAGCSVQAAGTWLDLKRVAQGSGVELEVRRAGRGRARAPRSAMTAGRWPGGGRPGARARALRIRSLFACDVIYIYSL